MSAETLQAVHEAIVAHVKSRNENPNLILNDWFVSYAGMLHDEESPTGLGHFSGYMVNADSTPQSSLGTASLGLDELRDSLDGCCNCAHHAGGDD